jgi:uncharacterized membrane protein YraQ (UPF0718 family)
LINAGAVILYGGGLLLGGIAVARRDDSFRDGLLRALEQAVLIVPRLIFALIAASFIVKLIPTELIVEYLGAEADIKGIVIGSLAGLVVPAGPAVAFAVAASFALEGASVPALVSFLTAWSVFSAHRIFIFELPLLGAPFVRLRLLSVIPLPFIAGAIAALVTSG